MLKNWITHEEAVCVHKMLEAFRDEAIYERAVRDLASRANSCWHVTGAESDASAKEYLFMNSVGQAGEPPGDEEYGESHNQADSHLDSNPLGTSGGKGKPSHRQRKRRANFFASMPRTPSSGTYQS